MSNTIAIFAGLALLLGGIFSVATSSMGIECYNNKDNVAFKEERMTNFNFLIFNVVCAILLVLFAILAIYMIARGATPTRTM